MESPRDSSFATRGTLPGDRDRLGRFIVWQLAVALFLGVAALLLFPPDTPTLRPGMLLLGGYVLVLLTAWRQVRGGELEQGARLLALALLIASLVAILIEPSMARLLVILPITAAVIGLPYLGPQALRRLFVAALLTVAAIYLVSSRDALQVGESTLVQVAIFLIGTGLMVGLTLDLLWQYRRRLAALLNEAIDANSLLETTRRELEQKVRARTEELEAREQRYRQVAEMTSDFVYRLVPGTEESLEVEWVTDAVERVSGYPRAELPRSGDWRLLVHPEDQAGLNERRARLLRGEAVVSEYRVVGRDGKVRWLRDHARPEFDPDEQRLVAVLGAAQEITSRKRVERALENAHARLAGMLDAAEDAFISVDAQRRIALYNRGAEEMLGRTAGEMIGRPLERLIPRQQNGSPHPLWESLTEVEAGNGSPTHRGEFAVTTPDGRVIAIESSVSRLETGGETLYTIILRDITDRRAIEENLHEANDQLTSWVSDLERQRNDLTLISQMSGLLQSCSTAEEAYDVIARFASQLFPHDPGALYVLNESRNLVEIATTWGDYPWDAYSFPIHECWALRRGRIHLYTEPQTSPVCLHIGSEQPESYMCVPMVAQGEALGVLHIRQRSREEARSGAHRFEQIEQLTVTVAETIALALVNLKLQASLRSQAIRDPLTGLFNRRYMEESLERELHRAMRSDNPVGVIMLDIDHFKHFNDTFGHQAGDILLQRLGSFLQSHVRGGDIACRYGGEEFALIFTDATLDETIRRAEQIREAIRYMNVQHRGQLLGPVTISLGVAALPEHGSTSEALLGSADAALYSAKRGGRNRVMYHPLPM